LRHDKMPQVRGTDGKRIGNEVLDIAVVENHKRYIERIAFYRGYGYDLEKERDLILGQSLPISGDILEIGTGKGHFSLALARHGFNFISIDISNQDQDIARLNMRYFGLENRAVFRIEDAQRLSFPDRSFDCIFSINVFHHLARPLKVLDEITRVLRPSGKVILGDFSIKGLEIINACHEQEGKRHDYFRHRLEEARDYLARKGFMMREYQNHVQVVVIAVDNGDRQ
jgi:ubiquinone/menaquinone biosynthesis C-methylase UbiE